MELYFLRHGQAGERTEWTGDDDYRPLTEEGKAQTAREAAGLARLELVPDVILTSPLVRARQTAEIVAQELGIRERIVTDERIGPGFGRKELRQIVGEQSGHEKVMFVGHEPDFSKVVGRVIGEGDVVMKKGGLAVVELTDAEAMEGRLLSLVTPAMLELGAASVRQSEAGGMSE